MLKLLIIMLVFIRTSYSEENKLLPSVSFGPVQLGEKRLPIDLKKIKITNTITNLKVKTYFIKNSIQWVRSESNLLTPRARLTAIIYSTSSKTVFKYKGVTIIPEHRKKYLYTQLYVSLFNPGNIIVMDGKEKLGEISLKFVEQDKNTKTHLIDYSCSRYGVKISGADGEYLSVGCRLDRVGKSGNEKAKLAVTWTAANLKLLDGTLPPYTSFFRSNAPVIATVIDKSGKIKKISIKVTLPKRLYKLKLAYGLGPYMFTSEDRGLKISSKIAPSLMLYGNYYLTGSTSIRFFDALVFHESIFNNFGVYFAYNLATALDSRIMLVPLLGVQGLTFRFKKGFNTYFRAIYPQGFELAYKHPFGWENYLLVYGTFLSPSDVKQYQNLWIRFGKRIFWEINYISWNHNLMSSRMWGLSIGVPLGKFF